MTKKTRRILIIDDSPDDREFYTHLLKKLKRRYIYDIIAVDNAEEGIKAFKDNKIDCTFIDFNMPGKDGLNVVQELQEYAQNTQIAMVMLTGEPHQSVQAQAAKQGAMDYITKDSVSSADMLEKIIDKVTMWATTLNEKKLSQNG